DHRSVHARRSEQTHVARTPAPSARPRQRWEGHWPALHARASGGTARGSEPRGQLAGAIHGERRARRLVGRAKQIPAVSLEIEEHREATIRFVPRGRHEHYPRGCHSPIGCVEVLDAQEETDAPGELTARDCCLLFTIRSCEQDTGDGPRRTNDNPAFRTTIV